MSVTFIQAGSPTRSNACDPKLPARLDTPKSTPAHVSNERWPMEPPIDYAIGRSGGITQACQQLGMRLVDVSSARFATAAPQAERIIPGLGAQQDKQAAVWQWLTETNPLPLQGGVEIPAPDYAEDLEIPQPDYPGAGKAGIVRAASREDGASKSVSFDPVKVTKRFLDDDAGNRRGPRVLTGKALERALEAQFREEQR